MVVAQHSAESLAPFDWEANLAHDARRNQQLVSEPLMVAFTMVVRQILTDRESK
jgi:hypothetical protein